MADLQQLEPEYFTYLEVAKSLKVSLNHLYREVREKRLRVIQLGRDKKTIRILKSDLDAYLRKRESMAPEVAE